MTDIKSYTFEVNGGQNCLNIRMGKDEAWDLLESLASQLRHKEATEVHYSFMGKILDHENDNLDDYEIVDYNPSARCPNCSEYAEWTLYRDTSGYTFSRWGKCACI